MLIKNYNYRAQSMVEYVTLIAIAIGVLVIMSTFIRRGVQGMIRTVADNVGDQQGAEQRFDDSGHLINSVTVTRSLTDKERRERDGVINYIYADEMFTGQTTVVNAGFTLRRN